jgi:hypothetical protein
MVKKAFHGTLLKLPITADGEVDDAALDAMLDEVLPVVFGTAAASTATQQDNPGRRRMVSRRTGENGRQARPVERDDSIAAPGPAQSPCGKDAYHDDRPRPDAYGLLALSRERARFDV